MGFEPAVGDERGAHGRYYNAPSREEKRAGAFAMVN